MRVKDMDAGQENMLYMLFVGITSTGFITDPCPKDRLLWTVALSVSAKPVSGDTARGIIVYPYRNS